jgi:hypothetical protein
MDLTVRSCDIERWWRSNGDPFSKIDFELNLFSANGDEIRE